MNEKLILPISKAHDKSFTRSARHFCFVRRSHAEAKELSKSSPSWHPFITLSIIVTELRIVYYSYRTPAGNQLLFRRLFWRSVSVCCPAQALNIWISGVVIHWLLQSILSS